MPDSFDPYLEWLGIRNEQRPPNHYRLLGIELFEDDPKVIGNAADRQMAHVRTFQSGKHSELSQEVLNELAAAKICLLNRDKKVAYDKELRRKTADEKNKPDAAKPARGAPPISRPSVATAPSAVAVKIDPNPSASSSFVLRDKRKKKPAFPWLIYGGVAVLILVAGGLVGALYLLSRNRDDTGAGNHSVAGAGNGVRRPDTGEKHPPANGSNTGGAATDGHVEPPPGDGGNVSPETSSGPAPWELPKEVHPAPERHAPTVPLTASVGQALAAARRNMAARDLVEAGRQIALAESRSVTNEDRAEVDRLRQVLDSLTQFWDVVTEAVGELKEGDRFEFRSIPATVVKSGLGGLVLRAGGKEKTFPTTTGELDADLAVALAAHRLEKAGPRARADLAVFLAMDRDGDPGLAREYCDFALARSVPVDMLIPELETDFSMSVAADVPENPAGGDGDADTSDNAPKDRRLDVPEAAARSDARAKVKQIFAARYRDARKSEDWIALAKTLLSQAEEAGNNPAARFVLFEEAEECARRAGDVALVLKAVDGQAGRFRVDPLDEKESALAAMARTARSAAEARSLLDAVLPLTGDAVAADRFELADRFFAIALSAAQKTKNPDVVRNVGKRRSDAKVVARRFAAAQRALNTMKENPDDPDANLLAGEYLCFLKGEWDRGLAMLAKGSDRVLKTAAEKDLAAPEKAADQVEVGNAWWDYRAKAIEPEKRELMARAGHWYKQALPHLSSLEEVDVKARLAEIEEAEKKAAAAGQPVAGKTIDVLALVNPQRHAVKGTWTRADGATLRAGRADVARVWIPVMPQGSYELLVEYERIPCKEDKSDGYLMVYIPMPTSACVFIVGLDNRRTGNNGLYHVDGNMQANTNDKIVWNMTYGRHVLRIRVEPSGKDVTITTLLDGRPFSRWSGAQSRLSVSSGHRMPDPRTLGIGARFGNVVFYKVQLRMLTGKAVAVATP